MNMEKSDPNHSCNGCHYWRDIGICYACNYILIKGHSRGCECNADCSCRIPYDPEKHRLEVVALLNGRGVCA